MKLLGIDFSVRATGLVAAPADWDGSWSKVHWATVGETLPRDASDVQRARRMESLARGICAFARMHDVDVAWFESYGFAQARAAHTIAEACGVTRLELVRAGIEIRTANMSAARKLLLGKVPRTSTEVKAAVYKVVREAGAPVDSYDLADAFVALNWGMSELGGYCFAQAAA